MKPIGQKQLCDMEAIQKLQEIIWKYPCIICYHSEMEQHCMNIVIDSQERLISEVLMALKKLLK